MIPERAGVRCVSGSPGEETLDVGEAPSRSGACDLELPEDVAKGPAETTS